MSCSGDDTTSDASGDTSREKTTQWLEDVLQTYYTYLERSKVDFSEEEKNRMVPIGITVMAFDIGPGLSPDGLSGRMSTLSDLLALHVRFKVSGTEEEKTEDLIVKIPPNDKADREMAQLAQVDKREIHFYTEALPELEEWMKSFKVDIKLSVPRCYFAKYRAQAQQDDGLNLSDAESVLVLQDVRCIGYSMRDCNTGLSLEEALASLTELAKIHAVSWAMQETTGQPLDDKWNFAYKPRKAASAYKMMIEQGFPTLQGFLAKQMPDGTELLTKLQCLHPKAAELLCTLLEPSDGPAPSCLTHMDFWCNNLLFRKRTRPDGSSDNENHSATNHHGETESGDTECLILDWQMMAISRPTHDVALLLFTSLTPEVRRDNLDRLLRHYWQVFQDTAHKVNVELPFDFECIENEFNKSQLLALLLVIGSIDLALDTPATERRLMEALRDMAKLELI